MVILYLKAIVFSLLIIFLSQIIEKRLNMD